MDTNSVTGDKLISKPSTETFRTGFDLIDWRKKDSDPSPTVKPTVPQQNSNSKQ